MKKCKYLPIYIKPVPNCTNSNSPPGMGLLWGPGHTSEDNPKTDLQELDVTVWAGLLRLGKGPVAGSFCVTVVNNERDGLISAATCSLCEI
jgi:hypothetical protein